MSDQFEIREIPFRFDEKYLDLLCLRQAVLRTPIGSTYTLDQLLDERNDFHVGLYPTSGDRAIGCCLIRKIEKWYQMRQVAIAPDYQGLGLGQRLVAYFEAYALANGIKQCYIEARDSAVSFYQKRGYHLTETTFLNEESSLENFRLEKYLVT
jgi:N-acetylglutamate synthase-like GNAT family acetyltransferase